MKHKREQSKLRTFISNHINRNNDEEYIRDYDFLKWEQHVNQRPAEGINVSDDDYEA